MISYLLLLQTAICRHWVLKRTDVLILLTFSQLLMYPGFDNNWYMTYLNLPPVWNLEICTCYVLNKDEPNIPHYLTIFSILLITTYKTNELTIWFYSISYLQDFYTLFVFISMTSNSVFAYCIVTKQLLLNLSIQNYCESICIFNSIVLSMNTWYTGCW